MKKALYLLATLSDRDFEWLLQVGRAKQISAGTVLIREGEPTDALYIVVEGNLAVLVEALDDEEIARLSTGEVVGEMSFVDSRRPSATVKAIEDSLVWAIPRSQLAAKLNQDVAFASHFYQAIAAFLSDRLRSTVSRLGYHKDPQLPELEEQDLNPQVSGNLELAKTRLDWLLNQLRSRHK
ncbi:MAG TPA: cyclic nucleotide-binding domain-containing protein [Synechococcales cyanobacterium M55_K2018_004]|nr:cyclic nucleotide-binding domain-containing protein [Synechococcales cyanobacterium M55_K2018_004]